MTQMQEPFVGTAFQDPVLDSQAAFRGIMTAMAEPGTVVSMRPIDGRPRRLGHAMAAVALALCDYETPVWLDGDLREESEIGAYLRFHTGARIVGHAHEAMFALVARPLTMPALSAFAQGTPEYPDRSATIVMEVTQLESSHGWRLSGPGIQSHARLSAGDVASDFLVQWQANRDVFPRGVDLLLCCGERLAALPRSVRIELGA